jgi:hypothetical protein
VRVGGAGLAPRARMKRGAWLTALVVLSACDAEMSWRPELPDAGKTVPDASTTEADSGAPDSGEPPPPPPPPPMDAGPDEDSGVPFDAGFDAGTRDAGVVPDSGTPDAGPRDSGVVLTDGGRDYSSDRTKFFGPSRCAAAHVLFCEDFEGPQLDTTTWTVGGPTPNLDSTISARGSKSLHLKRVGNGVAHIKQTKSFPMPNNSYFGRMFVRFKTLPSKANLNYAHWTIVAASGTGVNGEIRVSGQLRLNLDHSVYGVGTNGDTGDWTISDANPATPRAVPLDEWMCIEWMHKGSTNETRFYWDAVEHPSLYTSPTVHGGNTNPFLLPNFTQLWVGWQEYQASTETYELWIDEIALDTKRIGCVL